MPHLTSPTFLGGFAGSPHKVYSCEVWRDLDWMVDEDKAVFDVGAHENLAAALASIFDSQICGGKRYDLATLGRRRANATYIESRATDVTSAMISAMDLTPLIREPKLDMAEYVTKHIEKFRQEVSTRLGKFWHQISDPIHKCAT